MWWRIALACLVHEKGKFIATLAGISLAVTLVLGQGGLYVGFRETSSAIIRHVGGDVWVMAKGVNVFENADLISSGTEQIVASTPCVEGVRPLVLTWSSIRLQSGRLETAIVLGYGPGGGSRLPWNYDSGLPSDLKASRRVAIDVGELGKLDLPRHAIREKLDLNGTQVEVAAITRGIRAFTLTPYVFTTFENAHRIASLPWASTTYWVLDLKDTHCTADVVRRINGHRELQAIPTEQFGKATEDHWVDGSGAGGATTLSAILALVVGAILIGQTLYSTTKEREKELATFRAMGATRGDLCSFVTWQAVYLLLASAVIGTTAAFGIQRLVSGIGLRLALTPGVFVAGFSAIVAVSIVASAASLYRVLTLDAGEVFR